MALMAVAGFALAFGGEGAFAAKAKRPKRHDARQHRQDNRIDQGVKSGELTKRETKRLHAEQRMIKKAEHRAEADGTVTGKEKARLENMQDKASKDIYRQKHDGQDRPDPAAPTTPDAPVATDTTTTPTTE